MRRQLGIITKEKGPYQTASKQPGARASPKKSAVKKASENQIQYGCAGINKMLCGWFSSVSF